MTHEQTKAIAHDRQEMDFLTKLPNRYSFERTISALLQEATGHRAGYLMKIDIDDLRVINQDFGYDVGDLLLFHFSMFLQSMFSETHLLFRMDSGAFILIYTEPPQSGRLQRDIRKILARCERPWKIQEIELYFTVGISAAYYPSAARTVNDMHKILDSTLHRAKETGRNAYLVYKTGAELVKITSPTIQRREIERLLHDAIRKRYRDFELYFQPIYQPESGCMIGAEALIRYTAASSLMLSPAAFIPIAEQTGLIVPIGEYVLRSAARFLKKALKYENPDFFVSVNVSIYQLQQPDYCQRALAILDSRGVPYANVILEITESMAATNMARIRKNCQVLRRKGIRIALDDFGTGYSSLSMVRTMPIDLIKLDSYFVQGMARDELTHRFIRLITEIGHELGLVVCAEGIEKKEQLSISKSLGIDLAQGYLYSRAISENKFLQIMRKQNSGSD